MIHDRDVRVKIAAVLRNEISIVDFARWIMSNSWNMHQDSSLAAINMVSHIHLLLAERDDYSLDDSAFRNELSLLLNNIVVSQPIDVSAAEQRVFALPQVANSVPWLHPAFDPVAA